MLFMTTAYSLIRFSTPAQAKGDSTRRQLVASERFCAERGLTLNRTLNVVGKSAYHGDHVATGPLAEFIKLVEAGKIEPGSWLIVEAMDRLDRRDVPTANEQFIRLLRAGITIHTMIDNQTYTYERIKNDLTAMLISIIQMATAHDYSKKLSMRISAKWEARREEMRAGRGKATNACAGWLKAIDGQFYEVPERVAVMKRIIAERHLGLGRYEIATRLNREGVPTFRGGDGWHPSTIAALVRNKALIGVYQPRKADGSDDGLPIEGFYPRLISDEDFWRAQWGPDNKLGAGSKTKGLANLLRGVCKCARCGASLVFVNTGSDQFLVCSKARRGLCDNRYHRMYPKLEAELLSAFVLFDFSRLIDHANPQANRIAGLEAEVAAKTATVDRLLEDFSAVTPPAVSKRIAALSLEIEGLTTELAEAKQNSRIAEARAAYDAYTEFGAMVAWMPRMADDERYMLRTRMAGELRRIIDTATADGFSMTIALRPAENRQVEILIDRATITGFRITVTTDEGTLEPALFPRDRVMGDSPTRAGVLRHAVGGDPIAA
jgi:hypothetical protein